jgi:hypothetical protein
MSIEALQSRSWNGTLISRRTTDGYVNATAMAKASGKQWSHYRETDRATTYLEALSTNTGIRVTDLYIAKPGEGTWIHPRLAVDFARWISADFAVWMDAWFLEELQNMKSLQVQEPQVILPDVLATVERGCNLLERLGGLDDRAQFVLRDIVLNHVARTAQGSIVPGELPAPRLLALQEALLEFTDASPSEATKIACKRGRLVKQVYTSENGRPPLTHKQLVGGRSCDVCDYEESWLREHVADLTELVSEYRETAK